MSDAAQSVQQVVSLNGGKLIGKTRLQKSIYLLEAFQGGYGFDFDYHYYGPYSEEVSRAASDAIALHLITEKSEITNTGLEYKVFMSLADATNTNAPVDQRRREIL